MYAGVIFATLTRRSKVVIVIKEGRRMFLIKKIYYWLTGRKWIYYLHISYKAQFSTSEWVESDIFIRVHNLTLKELRNTIQNGIERENERKIKTLTLVSITELPKGLYEILLKG